MTTTELQALADTYRDAVGARDAGRLPLAKSVQYSENGHRLRLDEGIWATATDAPAPYLTVTDPDRDEVVLVGIMPEGIHDFFYSTRLRLLAGRVKEIESVLVTKRSPLNLLGVEEPATADPVWDTEVPEDRRSSRDQLGAVVGRYYDGVERDDSSDIPIAGDCIRRVNGVAARPRDERAREIVVDEWGLPDLGGQTVGEQISSGIFRYIEQVDHRRVLATDEQRQVVVAAAVFQQRGNIRSIPELGVEQLTAEVRQPVSMLVVELFKVDDGEITAIESVAVHTPLGTRHGWRAETDPVLATGGRVT